MTFRLNLRIARFLKGSATRVVLWNSPAALPLPAAVRLRLTGGDYFESEAVPLSLLQRHSRTDNRTCIGKA